MADEPTSEFVSGYLFPLLLFLRNTVVGTVSFGLLIGAILFIRYLHRLSNLPKASREYRELSYHMQKQTILRYSITITCLILTNILFYGFFQMGKTCTHIGIVVWGIYGAYIAVQRKLKN